MKIIQDFIPKGRKNRPGFVLKPEFITVHDAGNPNRGANAEMHARYLKGDDAAARPASWHFTVDEKSIYQHLPLNESAWHAGDGASGPGNRKSIGIEICDNADGDRAAAEANAVKLIAALLLEIGIPLSHVVQHHQWSGKNCPASLRRPGKWEDFIRRIEAEIRKNDPLPNELAGTGIFKDVPDGHWAKQSIEKAAASGVIVGISDGVFGLGQPVTREQLAVILDRLGLLGKGGE